MQNSPYSVRDEQKLMTEMWDPAIADDPFAWVMFVFPWGKKGTPLENFKGPRAWQAKELKAIGVHIRENKARMARGEMPEIYKLAVTSGRGIGKSAFVSWMNLWMLSCVLGSTSITTANTEAQLKSRTWAEIGKWHALMMNSHWFDLTTKRVTPAPAFAEAVQKQLKIGALYYYADAQIWSEENPDGFAGAHNPNGMLLMFDEASGIPASIWSVSTGFFTDISAYRFWLCFSNPRRNTGEFYECFHKSRDFWNRRSIDSRDVEGLDTKALNDIIAQYGDDSDEARIEVKGQFPRQGDRQFISREVVENAAERNLEPDHFAGLIMGVDIARFGTDSTVIRFRRGRDARSIKPTKLKAKDNMQVANECAALIDEHRPDAVCIDAGNGTGVIDRLREMGYKVHEVWFGEKSGTEGWSDQRTEMWAKMKEWLNGGCIDNDTDLKDDLVGPEYEFDKLERIKLESKEKMKKRGIASPDNGDALAVTFAIKVARSDIPLSRKRTRRQGSVEGTDYDVYGG